MGIQSKYGLFRNVHLILTGCTRLSRAEGAQTKATDKQDETNSKIEQLMEENRNQVAHVNKLLMEKDALQNQQLELKDKLLEQERANRYFY
jgi:hypothetical protein